MAGRLVWDLCSQSERPPSFACPLCDNPLSCTAQTLARGSLLVLVSGRARERKSLFEYSCRFISFSFASKLELSLENWSISLFTNHSSYFLSSLSNHYHFPRDFDEFLLYSIIESVHSSLYDLSNCISVQSMQSNHCLLIEWQTT